MFLKPVLLQNGRLSVAPVGNVTWEVRALFNGASKNLAAVTIAPTTFNFTAVSGTYYLIGLSLAFASTGTPDPNDFGNIASLTNGIDIDIRTHGVTNTVINIKDNFDLACTFSQYSTIGGAAGFLNNADTYTGSITFPSPILLQSTTGDFVRAVIKSATNGSGTDLRIYAHLYKEV